MWGKVMSKKRVIISVVSLIILISLIILVSRFTGCFATSSKDMVKMIDKGETITLELASPSYDIEEKGKQQEELDWVQLDQLKTFNQGFRQEFDELFNINIVTEKGVNGKSGCLYVDEAGDREGNTTLEDAFRNKTFVTKYWDSSEVKGKLVKLGNGVYTDVADSDSDAIAASINAYYNLMPDATNPESFNGTQSLTREQFYELVYKTENGVQEIEIDKNFETAVGGATSHTKFAQGVDEYGFLSVENKSLDGNSYSGSISRSEAIYMLVNKHFKDEMSKVTGKEKAFKDNKNAGDLALKAGFKYKDKESKEIVAKGRWQSYTLAYMLKNNNKGMQEEVYKAMVVAKNLGLLTSEESRWDEPLSKSESIMLIANTQLAKNKAYGYLSEEEYGKINLDKFKVSTGKPEVLGVTEEGLEYGKDWIETEGAPSDPNKVLSVGITLWDAKLQYDSTKAAITKLGIPQAEIDKILKDTAESLGTTVLEIESLPDTPPAPPTPKVVQKQEKPAQKPTQAPVEKPTPQPSKPANNGGGNGGVDADGYSSNGADDFIKEHSKRADGFTPYDGPGLGDGN
ncbi:hypothetical protein KPL33_13040 [Clostridium algidicarnis]|uniref:hypothetical protein n=1 Tax=Clostridium algidicarnis TaxID=37659 RepID=UPI001C0DAEE6|nr:hypothetical protein [Clostridium algidicarnis]MBU3207887.1 hypothetical protein [Clostridium algidicarnis]